MISVTAPLSPSARSTVTCNVTVTPLRFAEGQAHSQSSKTPAPAIPTVSFPSGWSVASTSCLREGTYGRALAGASTASGTMTIPVCIDFCQSKGFQYAGIEYSGECYCDNQRFS